MNSSVRFVSVYVFQAHTDTHFTHDYAKKGFCVKLTFKTTEAVGELNSWGGQRD